MSTMYCNLCNRSVEAKREIGVGSFLLVLITGGVWLVALLFYRQRCSICKTTAVSNKQEDELESVKTRRRSIVLLLVFFFLATILQINIIDNLEEKSTSPVVEIKNSDLVKATKKVEIVSHTENEIDYDMVVCSGYKNKEDKERCIKEMSSSDSKAYKSNFEKNYDEPNYAEFGSSQLVSQDEYKVKWPFLKFNRGYLSCEVVDKSRQAVWLITSDTIYALNGQAISRVATKYKKGKPVLLGRDVSSNVAGLGDLIKDGLKLCR